MINKNDLRKAISSIAISNAKRNTIYKAFSDLDPITKEEFDSVKSDISKVVESMLTKDTVGKANGVASLDSNGSVPIEQLGNIDTTVFLIVRELPTTDIKTNKIYIIPNKDSQGNNVYIEYLYVENVWENLGEFKAEVDLSEYVNKSEFNNTVSDINTNIATKANTQDVTNAIGELQDKIGDRIVVSGNVTNNPDEEDITTEGDTPQTQVLKLKDRTYDNLNASGKGYKILRKNWQSINGERKNVLTQEMINEPNTIYEIRYDFDLNGAEIEIKEECVLKFEGGSLSNGTINGNLYDIEAQKFKIFENINIKGAAKLNNYYLIDWWVKTPQYEFVKENNTIDNYQDIQSALNCGAENFIFSSDRYYYIKQTLLINGEINLFSDVEHKHYDGNDRAHRKEPPCIYSNEIITLIEYRYKSNTYKGSIYIGTINLVCNKPFSDLSEKDVPILYIHADQSTVNDTVWGVVIKCNIKAKDLIIDLKNEYPDIYEQSVNIYAPNYTGLMIKADYAKFSYIKVYSYICMTYYGIIIPKTENNKWITDVTIEGDTRCVIGGKFIGGGNPVRIFGSHQPEYALAKTDEIRNVGYFVGKYIQLYGFIWDISKNTLESKGNCPKYPIQINSVLGDYNNPLINNSIQKEFCSGYRNTHLNYRNINIQAIYSDNLLNYIGSEQFKKIIRNFKLTIDGVPYKEKTNIYNHRYLFGSNPFLSSVNANVINYYPQAYIIKISNELTEYKLKFRIEPISYNIQWDIIIKAFEEKCHIKYTNFNGEIVYDKDVDMESSYYQYAAFVIHVIEGGTFEITIHIGGKTGERRLLPLVKIPWNLQIYSNVEAKDPAINKGEFVYNVNTNKAGWWNGTEWVDNNGYSVNYITKGTTSKRPILTSTSDGFEYYDTTLKKKVIWNGKAWVNMDGSSLGEQPTQNESL